MTMRLRASYGPYSRLPERNNRHISCGSEHTRGHPRLLLLREGGERHGGTNPCGQAAAMSAWSWLKLRVSLWLLRKMVTVTKWLLLLVTLLAAWPLTLVAVIEYAAAWLRGWPAIRLFRTAAWALPVTAVWLIIVEVRGPGWRSPALIPGRAWSHGFYHPGGAGLAPTLALPVPGAAPPGLARPGLAGRWRTHAVPAGGGGGAASAPILLGPPPGERPV